MPGHHFAPPPQSGLGIASFVTSLVAAVLLLILIGTAGVLGSQHGGLDEESAPAILLGLGILLTAMAQITALGLGIGGLMQTGRSRLFPVLGTVFASTALFGTLLLMLIGIALES